MVFTSYAQNFEDVMLWRAFKGKPKGFYIDVGANHPEIDSVTKSFYDRGWNGINIEPVENEFNLLLSTRSRDTNLNVAIGSVPGSMPLYTFPGTGLSTLDSDNARTNASAGHDMLEREISIVTLANICETYVTGPVDFLKVDVEGWERDVLLGADFRSFRPNIIIVESTLPNSQQSNHDTWESVLLDANYSFIWFDGLNRFYTANEHLDEIAPLFKTPPNIFDGFISRRFSETSRSEEKWLRAEWRAALDQNEAIKVERDGLLAKQDWLQAEWDGALAQRDAVRFERDAVTTDRDWLRSEWKASTAQCDAMRLERDAVTANRDWLRSEWEATLAQMDAVHFERDALIAERDWLRSEWDAARVQNDTIHTECSALRIELTALRVELKAALAQNKTFEAERDAATVERDQIANIFSIYRRRVEADYEKIRQSIGWKIAWPLRFLRIDPPLELPVVPHEEVVSSL